PGGMFAARAIAEILARDQDRRAGMRGIVEDIARLLAYCLERAAAEPQPRDGFEPVRGNDDVGVDILGAPGIGAAFDMHDRLHQRAGSGKAGSLATSS